MVVEKLEITDQFEEDPPEEEEEEEEEEEDLEDPMDKIREDCQASDHCAHYKSRWAECEDRVSSGNGDPEEHCTEELLDFLHCADHCVPGRRSRDLVAIKNLQQPETTVTHVWNSTNNCKAELENTAALLSYGEMFQSKEEQELHEAKEMVKQLQYEAKNTKRELVSVAAADLQKYVEERQSDDPLVVGISDRHNPFIDKKGCCIL